MNLALQPGPASERVEQWLRAAEADARVPVAARVETLLQGVRAGSERYDSESWDQASERHAEDFIRLLREQFPGRVLEVSRPPTGDGEQGERDAVRVIRLPQERFKLADAVPRLSLPEFVVDPAGDEPDVPGMIEEVVDMECHRHPGSPSRAAAQPRA